MSNVEQFPGVKPEMTIEQKRMILKQVREDLPWLLEFAAVQAKIAFEKYQILKAQGFTEKEAIELLKGTV